MAFLEAGQARAIFLLIAVVPMLFGILVLTTRQFVVVGVWFFALYGLLHLGLWTYRPEVLSGELEILQAVAFALVIAEITIIGGFISSLRGKLRQRNLELGVAMEQIRELVNVDALTGVYNRRRLFEVISEESDRYSRMPGSFSICLMDIDYFKEVNDTYGHQAGDMILQAIARSVKDGLKTIDCFGRPPDASEITVVSSKWSPGITAFAGCCTEFDRVTNLLLGAPIPFRNFNNHAAHFHLRVLRCL